MTLSYSLITGRTAADKTASAVGRASEGAGTSETSGAHLHANRQTVVELITVRTAALVTANCVDAGAVAAGRRGALIFVYALIVI